MIESSLTWALAPGRNSRSAGQDYADSFNFAECGSLSRAARARAARHNPGLGITCRRCTARLHKVSLGLPRALNNAAIGALIAVASAGTALVDDDHANKAVAELTRD
jgi:hypothetical protein